MECNKDEALRAKDIAARKFSENDFAGAKKFALKAQNLYPGLEGVSQMIATLEVYISAANKINGEMDMYGVLGVNPLADDETIKKHYRKLVLQLHPDKNKFIGADGAFQLVSEAFNFLSDKAKRSAYNSRRNVKTVHQKAPSHTGVASGSTGFGQFQQKFPGQVGASVPCAGKTVNQKAPSQGGSFGSSRTDGQVPKNKRNSSSQQKIPTPSGSSAVPSGANGHSIHSNSTASREKAPKSSNRKASPTIQSFFKKDGTFWTMCTRCKMQYEYMKVYLNQILKCPHCQMGFTAVEVPAPSNLSPVRSQHLKLSSSSGPQTSGINSSFGAASARWSPLFGTTYSSTVNNNSFGATSAQNATAVKAQAGGQHQLPTEKVKREHEEAKTGGKRENSVDFGSFSGEGPLKKKREMDDHVKNPEVGISSQPGIGNPETRMRFSPELSKGNAGPGRTNYFAGFNSKIDDVNRELSSMETRKMLSEKALSEVRKKVIEWQKAKEARMAAKEEAKAKPKKSKVANDVAMPEAGSDRSHTESPVGDAEQEAAEVVTMTVPDPDFHVFDLDRAENCFGDNQVWAAYDNDDGMPRFYAMIHEVISLNPFMVRLSWLNSKSTVEFGSLNWVGHGFIKSCGDFWVGRRETNNSLNSFSHKVSWVKGFRGVIQIYPRKGEIWALYKNWSPDWNKDTPEEVVHAYEMVEVLDDYNEEQGVRVASLYKAAGFLTVFHKQPDPKEVKRIMKEQMFRFSHQVPSHVLTGEEGKNAPKGYIELDPAATPMELLQVTTRGVKDSTMGTGSIVA